MTYPGPALDTENAFRLLELQAGQTDDPVTVRLLACSFGTVSYEAVSYAWGDADQKSEIRVLTDCDDKTCATISVTTNCHNALITLRKSHGPRVLWVDSICIDQYSIPERSHQVSLMAQIYQGALRVVVYLGPSADDSDEAMHWIREIDQPSDYGAWPSREERPRGPLNMDSIRALFQRPWFRRVWVLQEIAFAQDAVFVCGQSEASWDSIRAFYHFNQSESWVEWGLAYPVEYAVLRSYNRVDFIHYNHRLCKLLMDTKDCRATDPRDKLYAMLHLLHWDHEKMIRELEANQNQSANDDVEKQDFERLRQATYIQADYEQSVQQVYTKLTIILLEHFGLRVLQVRKAPSHVEKLPTWIIDWEAITNSPYQTQQSFIPFRPRYTSSNISWSCWSVSQLYMNEKEPKEQLRVRALGIDRIAFIGDVCDIRQDIFPLKQWTRLGSGPKWWHQEPPIPPGIPDGCDYHSFTPFLETLVAGYAQDVNVVMKLIETITLSDESNDGARKVRLEGMTDSVPGNSDTRQLNMLFDACDGRRFFITDSGHIGLAPEAATIGDLTFEVQGLCVPYVMRPCPDAGAETSTIVTGEAESLARNERSVTMVGECWIHGIMNGPYGGLKIRDCSSYSEDLVIY